MNKSVLRQALEESGRPLKAIAAEMDVKASYLADALNDAEPQRFPSDLLAPFMRATGSRHPLCELAAQMDCAVVALPTSDLGTNDVRDRFMRVVDELGQDSAVIQRALGDGEITPIEGREIAAGLRRSAVALMSVVAVILANVEKPAPARMTMPVTAAPADARRRA